MRDIIDHRRVNDKPKLGLEFKVRWIGFEDESWEPYVHVRKTAALDAYALRHPELGL